MIVVAQVVDRPETHRPPRSRRGLVVAVLLAPVAWAVHLSASAALVPVACEQGSDLWLHVTTLVTLAVAVTGLVLTRRALRAGDGGPAERPPEVDRFIAALGWWGGLLSTGLIIAEGLLVFGLEACP